MNLQNNITSISGIGPIVAEKLKRLRIETVFDLLHHLPSRYEDRRIVSKVLSLQSGSTVTIIGKIKSIKNEYTKNGKNFQKAEIFDDSGETTVIWFNQSYLTRSLHIGDTISLYGKVDWFGRKLALISPEIGDAENIGKIVPIYPETAGLTSKFLRNKINDILEKNKFEDYLPKDLGFPEFNLSLKSIHFPEELNVEKYRQRLAVNELIELEKEAKKKTAGLGEPRRCSAIHNSQVTNRKFYFFTAIQTYQFARNSYQ